MTDSTSPDAATRPPGPPLAYRLGYAGLLPFAAGAVGVWIAPAGWKPVIEAALIGYAAVILAFMGAVHWGLAMAGRPERRSLQLGLSVLPALLGWVALLLPAGLAYPLVMAAFLALLAFDRRAVALGLAPRWYPSLRTPLTAGVLLSLALAYAHLLAR